VHDLEHAFVNNRELKHRVMRVKKTLPGLILGKRATALPPLEEKSAVIAKGQMAMSGQLSGAASKKSLASPP